MKKLLYFAFFSFFTFLGTVFADSITMNWMIDDSIYYTTTCDAGDGVDLPPTPTKTGYVFKGWKEHTNFRGNYINWSSVPKDTTYTADRNGDTKPLYHDYIIVADTTDFIPPRDNVYTIVGGNVSGSYFITDYLPCYGGKSAITLQKVASTYSSRYIYAYNTNKEEIFNTSFGPTKTFNFVTPYDTAYIKVKTLKDDEVEYVYTPIYTLSLSGTWKFVYEGVWETDGIAGWRAIEQIE